MTGFSYRVAIKPMVPGDKADPTNFRDSRIDAGALDHHQPGERREAAGRHTRGEAARRGLGRRSHRRQVDVSTDFGATWTRAKLDKPKNRYDWQRWTATVKLPSDGYYEIWTRGDRFQGRDAAALAANWNPQGYGGNAMHRIAVLVG